MATLSDINNFIVLRSDNNLSEGVSSDTSALSIATETVNINSVTRRYEEQIHFTNPDNTYCGDFTTVDRDTGEIINLTTAVSNVLNINTMLSAITEGYKKGDDNTYNNSKIYTDRAVGGIESNLMGYVSSYIDNTINTLNSDTAVQVGQISQAVSEHTSNNSIHISDADKLNGKLNAGYLENFSVNDLITHIALQLITHTDTSGNVITGVINNIDCGLVEPKKPSEPTPEPEPTDPTPEPEPEQGEQTETTDPTLEQTIL
jgi:hypothetical protein